MVTRTVWALWLKNSVRLKMLQVSEKDYCSFAWRRQIDIYWQTPCTCQPIFWLIHQGTNLNHYHQLQQPPSFIHTGHILQLNMWPICLQLTGVGSTGTGLWYHSLKIDQQRLQVSCEYYHAVATQVVGRHAGFESQGYVFQYAITAIDKHASILRHYPSVKI